MKYAIKQICLGIVAVLMISTATAQTSTSDRVVIPLYPKGSVAPLGVLEIREKMGTTGSLMIRNVSEPTLELFRPLPGHANGTAVIITPGGGFVGLAYDSEGTAIARMLVQHGVTAFVLKHRTIRSPTDPMQMPDVHMKEMDTIMRRAQNGTPVEMPRFAGEQHAVEDGARAVMLVREHANEWNVDAKRLGFMGFSSGAFLAADLAIGPDVSRPNFVALIYGGLRSPVPFNAPPAFIAAASDDEYLPNDPVLLYSAWRQAGVDAELHVFQHGGHGFDLRAQGTTSDYWFKELTWWMQSRGLTGSASPPPK
jgi:acetyl esterase/lipase